MNLLSSDSSLGLNLGNFLFHFRIRQLSMDSFSEFVLNEGHVRCVWAQCYAHQQLLLIFMLSD